MKYTINVAWHWQDPHHLNIAVLAVVDSVFGLHVFHIPNKPYGFCGCKAPCLLGLLKSAVGQNIARLALGSQTEQKFL